MNQVFKHPIEVRESDIDEMNHVNNVTYLNWLIEAAVAHSESLGYTLERFLTLGGGFVVRRHELDYLRPAILGDQVEVHTWLSSFEGSRTFREYRIIRKRDQKVIFLGKTLWVWIDIQTGRAKDIPMSVVEDYRPFFHGAVPAAL